MSITTNVNFTLVSIVAMRSAAYSTYIHRPIYNSRHNHKNYKLFILIVHVGNFALSKKFASYMLFLSPPLMCNSTSACALAYGGSIHSDNIYCIS